jgi:undecaprenyl-diphosphatase
MDFVNNILQPIILGLVQGLGEFLPISSSGHLILVPWIFNFPDPGLAFDVALHGGTLIAVVAYFWRDWLEIIAVAFRRNNIFSDKTVEPEYNSKTLWLLVIATIPGVIIGVLLEKQAETVFRNPLLVAFTLFLMGAVLYLVDRYARGKKSVSQLRWSDSIWIGLSQAVAIIPGVSRSGATITAGRAIGASRRTAARFSFLLATPIILGATLKELPTLLHSGLDSALIIGMLVAAVSGFLSIKYLLKFIDRYGYQIFFWYRLALAVLIIIVYMARG